jgi:indolepyruvate ferredoxin oxidoreductase
MARYRADVQKLLAGLNADNHALALEIASLPEQIRGFGHVKERNHKAAQLRREALLARWADPAAQAGQARAA